MYSRIMAKSDLEKAGCSMLWKARATVRVTGVEAGVQAEVSAGAEAEVSAGVGVEPKVHYQMDVVPLPLAHAMSLEAGAGAVVARAQGLYIAHEVGVSHQTDLNKTGMAIVLRASALAVVVSHQIEWKRRPHRLFIEIACTVYR